MSFRSKLLGALNQRIVVGFSLFGLSYGLYNIIDMSQSGKKYNLAEYLDGKTYIVTGATSGLGKIAAEELAKRNARVIMACRNREKCIRVRRDIVLNTKNKQVFCRRLDLEDFDSIENFVKKVTKGDFELDRIDGLINNAGTMELERKVNKLGIEKTLAVNHLGTFLLTGLLLDKLFKQNHPVRIVFLNTNVINRDCKVDFEDLNYEKRKYDYYKAYKQSKLAEALFAKELSERVDKSNVSILMVDPGKSKTNIDPKCKDDTFFVKRWFFRSLSFFFGLRKAEKAIRPVLYSIADPEVNNLNGLFIDRERNEQAWPEDCENIEIRKQLWLTSEKWTSFYEHLKNIES